MENDTRIGVDIAKSVFQIAVSDRPGRVSRCERLRRGQFLEFFAQQPAATVFMEACGSAHYWARRIEQLGHRVVLLPPHQVRPYVKRNKTDRTDAKGILEASRNEDIRPVPVKSVPQQVLTSLHRLRQGWMTERTARLNALRGLLRELGVFIPVGSEQVVPALWGLIEDADSDLPDALRPVFAEACQEIREIEGRIKQVERQLVALAQQLPAVVYLLSIPGIGLLTATALVAFIGDVRRFPSGRHLASYLGLTPREYSSGLKRYLGRISKRGDGYLRTLLIHGARSVLLHARTKQPDRLRVWGQRRFEGNETKGALAPGLHRVDRADGGTGRTGAGKAENKHGPQGRCHRLASRARIPSWPGALTGSTEEAGDSPPRSASRAAPGSSANEEEPSDAFLLDGRSPDTACSAAPSGASEPALPS